MFKNTGYFNKNSFSTLKSVKLYLRSTYINGSRLNFSSLLNLESQLLTLS